MKPRGDHAVLPDVRFGFSNAAALATRSVPLAAAGTRASAMGELLRSEDFVIADEIVLCRDGRFEGQGSFQSSGSSWPLPGHHS